MADPGPAAAVCRVRGRGRAAQCPRECPGNDREDGQSYDKRNEPPPPVRSGLRLFPLGGVRLRAHVMSMQEPDRLIGPTRRAAEAAQPAAAVLAGFIPGTAAAAPRHGPDSTAAACEDRIRYDSHVREAARALVRLECQGPALAPAPDLAVVGPGQRDHAAADACCPGPASARSLAGQVARPGGPCGCPGCRGAAAVGQAWLPAAGSPAARDGGAAGAAA